MQREASDTTFALRVADAVETLEQVMTDGMRHLLQLAYDENIEMEEFEHERARHSTLEQAIVLTHMMLDTIRAAGVKDADTARAMVSMVDSASQAFSKLGEEGGDENGMASN